VTDDFNVLRDRMEYLQRKLTELENANALDLDGTDFAHPAWWRGQDHAVAMMTREIGKILEGEPIMGVCQEPWQTVRVRIAGLTEDARLGRAVRAMPVDGVVIHAAPQSWEIELPNGQCHYEAESLEAALRSAHRLPQSKQDARREAGLEPTDEETP